MERLELTLADARAASDLAHPGDRGGLEEAVGYSLPEWVALNSGWPLYHILGQAIEAHAIRTGEKRDEVDQVA